MDMFNKQVNTFGTLYERYAKTNSFKTMFQTICRRSMCLKVLFKSVLLNNLPNFYMDCNHIYLFIKKILL